LGLLLIEIIIRNLLILLGISIFIATGVSAYLNSVKKIRKPIQEEVQTLRHWHFLNSRVISGTRDHNITEEKNILIVQKHMTNGHYDLKVKGLDSKFTKIFIFDKWKLFL
jgi:hypothetical protein